MCPWPFWMKLGMHVGHLWLAVRIFFISAPYCREPRYRGPKFLEMIVRKIRTIEVKQWWPSGEAAGFLF